MTRKTFLTLSSSIALLVGAVALLSPAALLAGKGVPPTPSTIVWVREVAVLLLAVGALGLMVRDHPDSPTMRAYLGAHALLQLGLFPIELFAYRARVITELAGVLPNSILHLVLAGAFAWFWARCGVRSHGALAERDDRAPRPVDSVVRR